MEQTLALAITSVGHDMPSLGATTTTMKIVFMLSVLIVWS